jgi:PAS domain S-box-containing protein
MRWVRLKNSDATFAAIILAVSAIFLVDVFTPLGITVGLFYLLPTLLCLRSYNQRRAIVVAALSSVLLIAEVPLKPPGGSLLIGIINDSLVLVVIWASVFAGIVFVRRVQQFATAKELQHLSEEQLRAVLNNAYDAIIVIDGRGVITGVNPATERMFGYAQQELIGQNVRVLMPPPFCDEHDAYIARYLRTGEAHIIGIGREVSGLRKDGSTFPVDLTVSRIDHMGLFTGTIHDNSLRKELQKQVLEIAVEEQRRIGQELHDGTGQELTGLSLFAGTLVDLLNKAPQTASDPKAGRLLEEDELLCLRQTANRLSEGLVEANRHVQQLSRGIMPVQIEAEGLRSALEELAASTDSPPKVNCRFDCLAPVMVANNTAATHLYRIAQEAVNNALRHSRADQIRISFLQGTDGIVLEVCDNGIGFDPAVMNRTAALGTTHGFGLRILNYRAGMIGGTLRITRGAEGGMLVKCTLPRENTLR